MVRTNMKFKNNYLICTIIFVSLIIFTILSAKSVSAGISGCTEDSITHIIECTGSLSGTAIDVDNASIWIHDATINGLQKVNTSFANGYINVSNFTVTGSPAMDWISETMYLSNYSHSGIGSNGATGNPNDRGCHTPVQAGVQEVMAVVGVG